MKKFLVMIIAMVSISCLVAVWASTAVMATSEPAFTKEEAIEIIWDSFDHGDGDDGTQNAGNSFFRNFVTDWVNENYDNGELCWYTTEGHYYSLIKEYNTYRNQVFEVWDFEVGENGENLTLYTADNVYTFEYVNGMWNQIDKNGNVVDTFPPVSTLDENATTTTQANDADSANADSGNRVTGTVPTETQTTTIAETNESNDDSSSPTVYLIIGGAFVGAAIGAGAFFLFKNKKG